MRIILLFCFLLFPAAVQSSEVGISGIWETQDPNSPITISIKQNGDLYKVFRLLGEAEELTDKISSKLTSQEITTSFEITDTASFYFPIKGSITVPDQESTSGGTKTEFISIPLIGNLENNTLYVTSETGKRYAFQKLGFFSSLRTHATLIISSII